MTTRANVEHLTDIYCFHYQIHDGKIFHTLFSFVQDINHIIVFFLSGVIFHRHTILKVSIHFVNKDKYF